MAIISIPTSISGISAQGTLGSVLNGPLAALFGGSSPESIKYPSDLGTSADQSHYVQFFIKEVIPAGYQKTNPTTPQAIEAAAATSVPGKTVGLPGAGSLVNGAAAAVANLATWVGGKTNLQALGDVAAGTINKVGSVAGNTLAKGLSISPTTTKSKAYISLYMPDTLTASYNAQYEELSLTADNTFNTLRMIDSLATPLKDAYASGGTDGLISQIGTTISTDPSVAWLVTQYGAGILGKAGINASTVQTLLLKGQGYALNPQMQMIYKGTDLRSFSLTFTFSPKSAKDSQSVAHILYLFKRSFAPSLQPSKATSTESMFLVAPDIFNIQFNLGGAENTYLPKYGDCVLTGIDVNYAPNGWSAYADGSPVQTTLTLQFREIEMVTREKLDAGAGFGKASVSAGAVNGIGTGDTQSTPTQNISVTKGMR